MHTIILTGGAFNLNTVMDTLLISKDGSCSNRDVLSKWILKSRQMFAYIYFCVLIFITNFSQLQDLGESVAAGDAAIIVQKAVSHFSTNFTVDNFAMLALSLLMLACSGCCVITSVLLLIGLCVDSRRLLVPWMISVFTTTLLDFLVSLYLLLEAEFNQFLLILFSIDIFLLALNVYCIVCVYSQYQEYMAGRGYPVARGNQLPEIEYRSERCFLSSTIRTTTDSGATNSSSVSVVHSSGTAVHNEATSIMSEDFQDKYRDPDSCEEKQAILRNESEHLLNVITSSTDRIIEPNESSYASNTNENSDSALSQIIEFDIENDERALKD